MPDQVDLVLLGGDLFHENKPSRETLVRAIGILQRYCISNSPVAVRVLGDQAAAFVAKCGLSSPYRNPISPKTPEANPKVSRTVGLGPGRPGSRPRR